MSDGFTVDYNLLKEQAKKLRSLKGEFDDARSTLKQAANDMAPGYESADNVRFMEQVEQICRDLANLSIILDNGATMLENDSTIYVNKESELANKAAGLPA